MATTTTDGGAYGLWYHDLCEWRQIEYIGDAARAQARADHLAGRERYLRVVPEGAGVDDYLRGRDGR